MKNIYSFTPYCKEIEQCLLMTKIFTKKISLKVKPNSPLINDNLVQISLYNDSLAKIIKPQIRIKSDKKLIKFINEISLLKKNIKKSLSPFYIDENEAYVEF